MVDYIVKTYTNTTELQKHLNQWKHQFKLTIESMNTTNYQGKVYITVIIKREKKEKEG